MGYKYMCCCEDEVQNIVAKLVSRITYHDLTASSNSIHVVFDNKIPITHPELTTMSGLFNDFSKHVINTLSDIHYRYKSIHNAISDIDIRNDVIVKGKDCSLLNSIISITDNNDDSLLNYLYWLSYSIKNITNINMDLYEYLEYNCDVTDEYGVINALSKSIDTLIGMEPSGCYPDKFMIGCDSDGVCHYLSREDITNITYYRYCLDTSVLDRDTYVLDRDILVDMFEEIEYITKIMPDLIMSVVSIVSVLENHKEGSDDYIIDLVLFSSEYIRYVYKYICLNTHFINRLYELSR